MKVILRDDVYQQVVDAIIIAQALRQTIVRIELKAVEWDEFLKAYLDEDYEFVAGLAETTDFRGITIIRD